MPPFLNFFIVIIIIYSLINWVKSSNLYLSHYLLYLLSIYFHCFPNFLETMSLFFYSENLNGILVEKQQERERERDEEILFLNSTGFTTKPSQEPFTASTGLPNNNTKARRKVLNNFNNMNLYINYKIL